MEQPKRGTINGVRSGNVEANPGKHSRIADIQLSSGTEAIDYEFCEHPPASLQGSVYHDRNNDGIRALNEEGIADALLSLLNEEGEIVDKTTTDEHGQYEFVGLRAGNYRVIQLQPDGWLDGLDRAGTVNGQRIGRANNPGDEISEIQLRWDEHGIDYDFGELQPATLEGRVHLSAPNGDCWDIDEGILEPVAGAVVQLVGENGRIIEQTTTAEDGTYFFDELSPGDYTVREITPPGLTEGGANPGTVDGQPIGLIRNGSITDIRLNSGSRGALYDFCEHPPATLSGFCVRRRQQRR